MVNIVEYRNDIAPSNEYPRRIVSPLTPSACCIDHMVRVGHSAIDATWRFYYKRCPVCGYTVRCFYAPSLTAMFESGRQVRLALAEMNLGTGGRKRRTRAEIEAERAAAERWPVRQESSAQPIRSLRQPRLASSSA
jgi:hypothetical protein